MGVLDRFGLLELFVQFLQCLVNRVAARFIREHVKQVCQLAVAAGSKSLSGIPQRLEINAPEVFHHV